VRVLEGNLGARRRPGPRRLPGTSAGAELEARLSTAEADVKELASRLVDSEHQAGRLMNLYVATYQLHSTLDPARSSRRSPRSPSTCSAPSSFVLLLRARRRGRAAARSRSPRGVATTTRLRRRRYRGGDPMVDATLADGVLRLGPTDGTSPGPGGGAAARPGRRSSAPW
jgi:hypothetical protein